MYKNIITTICLGQHVTLDEIQQTKRDTELVYARQLCMYFGKVYKVGSLDFIGEPFGKDHATVHHSIGVINNYIFTDPLKRQAIAQYEKTLDGYKTVMELDKQLEEQINALIERISGAEQRLINLLLMVNKLETAVKELTI